MHCLVVDIGADALLSRLLGRIPVSFLLVRNVMLDACDDTLLQAKHSLGSENATKIWVGAEAFPIAAS